MNPDNQRKLRLAVKIWAIIFLFCFFVAPQISSFGRPVQEKSIYVGILLMGALLLFGAPLVWKAKTPLQSRGLNVQFGNSPIFYSAFLIIGGIFGLALVVFGGCLLLGIHLTPRF